MKILARMVDSDGRILVPNFYDEVARRSGMPSEEYAKLPYDEKEFMQSRSASTLAGEVGYTNLELPLPARPATSTASRPISRKERRRSSRTCLREVQLPARAESEPS